MRLLGRGWKVVVDICTVIGVIITFFNLRQRITYGIIEEFKQDPAHGYFLVVVLVLTALLGSISIVLLIRRTRLVIANEIVKQNIENGEIKEVVPKDTSSFKKIIPSQSYLSAALSVAIDEAKQWAFDSELSQLYLSMSISNNKNEARIIAIFQSRYLKQERRINIPEFSHLKDDPDISRLIVESDSKTPFYKIPGWKKALLISFSKVRSRLGADYGIWISSYPNKVEIDFHFGSGKPKEKISFAYSKYILFCEEDSSFIDIRKVNV